MLRRRVLLGLVIVCLIVGFIPTEVGARRAEPGGAPSLVPTTLDVSGFVRVIDGDTIETIVDRRRLGVGLIGVSAPPGNTACGREATAQLRALVRNGVRLEDDPSQRFDERGRRMYRVLTRDGRPIGEELARAGAVHVDRRGVGRARIGRGQQSATVDPRLATAEAAARAAGRGCVWESSVTQEESGVLAKLQPPGEPPDSAVKAMVGEVIPPTMAVTAAAGAATLPSGFVDDLVTAGLTDPTAFAFLPDGRVLISEKVGLVKLYVGPGVPLTTFLDIRNQVNDYWDHGLLAIAADPNFADNGFVYLYFTYENDPSAYYDPKTGRLSRFTATGDSAPASTEVVILGKWAGTSCNEAPTVADCIPADGPSHDGGAIRFAADGSLFLTTGDAAHFNTVNANALRAQNTDSLAGKMLHITPSGAGLPTNPFWNGDAGASRSKVWAYGVRNGFRFGLRPGSGMPYLGDVGWGSWEEVDVVTAGANLGWPCYEGSAHQDGYEPLASCQALYGEGAAAVRMPLVAYSTIGGGSATGGAFYTGTAYPAPYRGAYFYGDYVQGWIRSVQVDADDRLVAGPTEFATGAGGPVDIQMGPDQALYYLAINDGQLRRARYISGANLPPIAKASATPTAGLAPLSVQFSSAGSGSPAGDTLSYTWVFGDGTPPSNAANPQHLYAANGTYAVTLTVDDGHGGTGADTVTITVGSRPPTATISTPSPSLPFQVGDVITYAGGATDPEDGTVAASQLSWQVILHHCPGGNCHIHPFAGGSGPDGSFIVPDHGDASYFEIRLTATDSSGLSDTASVTILPRTVQLTLTTAPAGLRVTYDGTSATAPVTRTTIVGSTHTIQVSSPQGRATFARWSDDGAQQHNVTVGTANVDYVATFDAPTIVTFDDRAGQDQPLDGQYPTGMIDWGTGTWLHSAPWGQLTSKSVTFRSTTITRGTFTFVTPRRLVGLEAYNGGGSASTVTLGCVGQPDKMAAVPAGQVVTIDTGWSGRCANVTLASTNGWDTNFDNFAYDSGASDSPPPTATSTAVPVPLPTQATAPPTATIPPAWCSPRPNVRVTGSKAGPGRLNSVIAAQTSSATPTNSLISVRFTRIDNAAARLNGASVSEGQTVALPAGAQQATLSVTRQAPGQNPGLAATVAFEVIDVCGPWPSFIGGGPGAF